MTYSKEYIDRAEEVILHTYNRFQIVLDKGNGVHLYDVDGKEYLDFAAGTVSYTHLDNSGTRFFMPAPRRSIGSCFPMTPVDATSTESSGICRLSAAIFAVSLQ